MSKLNLPLLSNSIADSVTLFNQYTNALSGALFFSNPTLISTLPTVPVIGTIYLVTAAASSPLTPGDVLLYLAATSTGYTTFTPPDGAIAGNYIRSTTASVSTWTATSSGGSGVGGSVGAITSGVNPATSAVGTIATYNVVASSGLSSGQYYAFGGVSGTFLCTSTPSTTTVNLQNIDGTVGVAIPDATKIIVTGKTGAAGTGTGGGASSWTLKTANYTALAGDRLRLDATASDIIITLPSTPLSTDADIFIQRLDLSTFKVLLRTGTNKINSLTSQDGLFAPATTNLIEGISYVNSAIGWLNQHNRLTFQAYTPPTAASPPALHLLFAQNLLDSSATPKTITPGGVTISTAQTKYPTGTGSGAAYFDGTKAIGFPRDGVDGVNILNFAKWTLECWIYPTVLVVNSNVIFSTYNNVGGAQAQTFILFADTISNGTSAGFTFTPVLNTWQHYAVTYDQPSNTYKGYYNGNLIGTITLTLTAGSTTNYIGGSPGDNNIGSRFFNGYIDDFIITPSIKYSANFTPTISP